MGTFNVSTAAQLDSAINNAQGGDTILLAAGDYGRIDWDNLNFSSEVVVKSADVNNAAVFGRTTVDDSSNISFENLEFSYGTNNIDSGTFLFLTGDVDGISVKDSVFEGAQNSGGYGQGNALGIGGGSKNVLISGNDISSFYYGVVSGDSESVTIQNNEIYNFWADGMQLLSVTDMLIEGNYLHDANKPTTSGVHSDFIQLFSKPGVDPTQGLTIRNNILDIGNGSVPQGIFLGNENAGDDGGGQSTYYRDIVVEGNIVYGARARGISIGETIGVTVRNNTVLQAESDSAPGFVGSSYAPTIIIKDAAQDVTIEDNVAFKTTGNTAGNWNVSGNVDIGINNYSDYFTAESLAAGAPNNWVVIEGSAIDSVGAHAVGTSGGGETGGGETGGGETGGGETGGGETGGGETGGGETGGGETGGGETGGGETGTDPINYIDLLGDLFGQPGTESRALEAKQSVTEIAHSVDQFILNEEASNDAAQNAPIVTLDFEADSIDISYDEPEIAQPFVADIPAVSYVAEERAVLELDETQSEEDFDLQAGDFLSWLF